MSFAEVLHKLVCNPQIPFQARRTTCPKSTNLYLVRLVPELNFELVVMFVNYPLLRSCQTDFLKAHTIRLNASLSRKTSSRSPIIHTGFIRVIRDTLKELSDDSLIDTQFDLFTLRFRWHIVLPLRKHFILI